MSKYDFSEDEFINMDLKEKNAIKYILESEHRYGIIVKMLFNIG